MHHRFAAACFAAALALGGIATSAIAEAPMQKVQAPGWYRFMVGDIEVTALSDGTVGLPVGQLLTNTTAEKTRAALQRSYLGGGETLETSVNGYLINTGSKLVLVDTGAAGLFGPTLGNLAANLRASGYRPEQVDEVYITHMHPDHVGGLFAGGARAFPNATIRADKADLDFWLSETNMNAAPAANKGFFQGAMASMNPYRTAGKVRAIEGDAELVPGVRVMASHGHTAGHSTYIVESKGQKLVLWGDLMHVAAVQFEEPDVTIAFDSDSPAAARQRRAAYADAAANGYLIAAAHLPFPGVGRVRAAGDGKGYVFIPLNYSSLR